VAIVLVFIVYNVVNMFIGSSSEKSEEAVTCLKDVNLEIVSSCYSESSIRFIVRNNNDFDYETDFFKIQIVKEGKSLLVATQPMTLKGLEQKEFSANLDNPADVNEFLFIPKIKQDKGYCYGQAIKLTPNLCV